MIKEENQINKKSTLEEVLNHEGAEEVLSKYSVPCLSCPMMAMEMNKLTLEQIKEMYGIDLDNLIKELNYIINSKNKTDL